MNANTMFLRLEGSLQAWGNQESKFVIRRTAGAPSKSGIIGLLCGAMGIPRPEAQFQPFFEHDQLDMGVRIDSPGVRWWDYHTVGAGMKMRIAEGWDKTKDGPILSRREYLCDASFLVAIQSAEKIIERLYQALLKPIWTPYLGRKACPPCRPLSEHPPGYFRDLETALKSIPWRPRLEKDTAPKKVDCILDSIPSEEEPEAPADAMVLYDVPLSFEPPVHRPRFVILKSFSVGKGNDVKVAGAPAQKKTPNPPRPRADYRNTEYRKARENRLERDQNLCVFCKAPGNTVQHITYRRAGGHETHDDLRSLCRLCHDAVTMLEYGMGMGLDRINPEEPHWRHMIIAKRDEIVRFRSLETRRRRLKPEEVE